MKVLVERQIPISTHRRSFGHAGADGSFSEDATHTFFEPVSEFHKKIRENYAGLDYRLIEAAVTDEDRDVTLQVRKVVSQTEITHSSVVDDASENSETRVVTGTRLDAFTKANALLKPYLVKIVVDGNEMSSDHIRRSAIARRAPETILPPVWCRCLYGMQIF